jgi:thioredoxin reductase
MDVFEVRHFVAVVARPSQCCGLLLCAQVCPNGSVHVDTTADDVGAPQPTTPAPVPGVFFAGDITGVPLIRNAVVQGERAAANAHARARSLGARDSSVVDVAILGAGPAGLAAALHAKRLGMTYAVLEQDAFAASIRSFPRSKLVLGAAELGPTADAQLLVGDSSKEELLARWTQTVRKERLQIEEHQRVTRVAKRDETFVVTSVGAEGEARTTSARSVIVAVGRRGSPRKLHAPIDDNMRSQVSYALVDAQAFAQQRVLVVGLGDAALEAIVALARQPGTSVTVVHRGTGLERGRQRNIDAVRRLLEQGVVRAFFSAKVERIGDGVAELVVAEQTVRVAVDRVLVLIGGEANLGLLMPLGEAGIPAPDAPPA